MGFRGFGVEGWEFRDGGLRHRVRPLVTSSPDEDNGGYAY